MKADLTRMFMEKVLKENVLCISEETRIAIKQICDVELTELEKISAKYAKLVEDFEKHPCYICKKNSIYEFCSGCNFEYEGE